MKWNNCKKTSSKNVQAACSLNLIRTKKKMKSWRMLMSKLINQWYQLNKLLKSSKALRSYFKTLLLMKLPEFLKKLRDSPFMKMNKISLKLLKSLKICKKAWQFKIMSNKLKKRSTLKKIVLKRLMQLKMKILLSRI